MLQEKDVLIIPDISANAGGVTGSYYEWGRDRQGFLWTEERVNRRLDRMTTDAFDTVYQTAGTHEVSLRMRGSTPTD